MITISGAGGKTGRAILRALNARKQPVRAMVMMESEGPELQALGAREYVVGDATSEATWLMALQGARALYLICPNVHPDEVGIVRQALAAAKCTGVEQVVYHSVLHPQVEAMPHHWQKMRAEELIFSSGIPFTILQPCAYMQNLLGYWESIVKDGILPVPYSLEARISMVDLEDVAEAAARVLSEQGHAGAVYELAGPHSPSQQEVAEMLSHALGRTVTAREIDRDAWRQNALASGLTGYALETLLKMFEYYDLHGLVGNSRVLGCLLQRPARALPEFINRVIEERMR